MGTLPLRGLPGCNKVWADEISCFGWSDFSADLFFFCFSLPFSFPLHQYSREMGRIKCAYITWRWPLTWIVVPHDLVHRAAILFTVYSRPCFLCRFDLKFRGLLSCNLSTGIQSEVSSNLSKLHLSVPCCKSCWIVCWLPCIVFCGGCKILLRFASSWSAKLVHWFGYLKC